MIGDVINNIHIYKNNLKKRRQNLMEILLTAEFLSERYSVTKDTIHRWARNGLIPAPLCIGSVYRWFPEDIAEWEMMKMEMYEYCDY